jgi:hypothetical protein
VQDLGEYLDERLRLAGAPGGLARPATRLSALPRQAVELVYVSSTDDGATWNAPTTFLAETNVLPWNTRVLDVHPTLVVDGDKRYGFFVGTDNPDGLQINLVGLAVTRTQT